MKKKKKKLFYFEIENVELLFYGLLTELYAYLLNGFVQRIRIEWPNEKLKIIL